MPHAEVGYFPGATLLYQFCEALNEFVACFWCRLDELKDPVQGWANVTYPLECLIGFQAQFPKLFGDYAHCPSTGIHPNWGSRIISMYFPSTSNPTLPKAASAACRAAGPFGS